MKAADGDISEIKTEFGFTAQKFKAKESDLKDFCEQTNLHRDRYREQVFAVDTEKKIANFGRSTSGKAVWANKKALTNGDNGGIIKVQGGMIMNINNIDSPIEQRNTAKGNPNAILIFDRPLNNRQQKLLDNLSEYDSNVIVNKKSVNMKDLSALTAVTGDEFALFTKGKKRLIIRGDAHGVNIDIPKAKELVKNGFKWSGHTHPGVNSLSMQISDGDISIWECFGQNNVAIYNSKGDYRVYLR